MPVVVAELHSQMAVVAESLALLGARRDKSPKVVFVMTDGGALPASFSNLVRDLKARDVLSAAVTCGHAFGGDLEAVSVYSGLLAAKHVCDADVIVSSIGPGVVGTSTPFGTTALQQGQTLNAAAALEAAAVAVVRLSFSDERRRHRGLSHHSSTCLATVTLPEVSVPLPRLRRERMQRILAQMRDHSICEKHGVTVVDSEDILRGLREKGLEVTTMGRDSEQDPAFFLACCAAGRFAFDMWEEGISTQDEGG